MAWTNPKDWAALEVVTASKLNTHLRDNLRYLKGMDGTVTIDDVLIAPTIGVNNASPAARLHVQENADGYASIIENLQTTGTPFGLIVALAGTASASRILSINQGTTLTSLTEVFAVRGDGVSLSQGHTLFHAPQTSSAAAQALTTTVTQLSGLSISITEAGKYWLFARYQGNYTPGGGDAGFNLEGRIYVNGVQVGASAFLRVPGAGPDFDNIYGSAIYTHVSGTVNADLRVLKSGGSAGSTMSGELTLLWVST